MTIAQALVDDLLVRLDQALPGRIEGFYVVGSACMDAFRPGMSDIDFVSLLDRELSRGELSRLRTVHISQWVSALARDVVLGGRWPLVCNGIYLRRSDLARSSLEVTPVAGHVAGHFRVAPSAGFDVNPVTWHTLADHGIAIRGEPRERLEIRTDVCELRRWSLGNLNNYWRRWAQRRMDLRALPRRAAAFGALGAPRVHCTIATGEIITKEAAGEYAFDAFGREWHPLIDAALAFRRGSAMPARYRRRPVRMRRDASAFVTHVVEAADASWGARC